MVRVGVGGTARVRVRGKLRVEVRASRLRASRLELGQAPQR